MRLAELAAIAKSKNINPGKHSKSELIKAIQAVEGNFLPLYYGHGDGWINVMKGAISKNASYFNSHRMMQRYATEAYSR